MATATNMQHQARDLRLMILLGIIGFADGPTLCAHEWKEAKSNKAGNRRLREHADAGYLHAVPYAPHGRVRGGRLPYIFCLTPRGAALVRAITGVQHQRFTHKPPEGQWLLHQLTVSRIVLALINAAAALGYPIEVLLEHDKVPGVPPDAPGFQRYVIWECFAGDDGETLSCRPDASCRILLPALGVELLFYIEADRGTETLLTVATKVEPLYALLGDTRPPLDPNGGVRPLYRKHWPQLLSPKPTVRVLFVTTAAERVANVGATIKTLAGADLWRLTTLAELTRPGFSLFDRIWRTPDGELRSIIKQPPEDQARPETNDATPGT